MPVRCREQRGQETVWFKMLRCWDARSVCQRVMRLLQFKSFGNPFHRPDSVGFEKSPLCLANLIFKLTKLCDFTFKIIIRTVPFRDHSCYCPSLKDYSSLFLIHHLRFCFKCFFLGSVTFGGFSSSEISLHSGKYRAVNRHEIWRVLQTAECLSYKSQGTPESNLESCRQGHREKY